MNKNEGSIKNRGREVKKQGQTEDKRRENFVRQIVSTHIFNNLRSVQCKAWGKPGEASLKLVKPEATFINTLK